MPTNMGGGYTFRAGDTTFARLDPVLLYTANNTSSTSWVAVTQGVTMNFSGIIRVRFSLYLDENGSGAIGYGCIEKNGSRIGTIRSNNTASGVEFVEDILVVKGDVIKIQAYTSINNYRVNVYPIKIQAINPTITSPYF